VAPVYSQAEIAYRRAKRMFRGLHAHNDTEKWLRFGNGATWWFKTGEKPDNLYGEDVWSAVVDEFTRCREDSWHALRSTLSATRGPVRMIGNVKGRGNWGYKAARAAQQGKDNWQYHVITADDAVEAGVLAEEEVKDARDNLPEAVFRELFYCEPADDEGNPFGIGHIGRCVDAMTNGTPIAIGVDLAKSHDWTVIVGLDENGAVCLFDRFQAPWPDVRRRVLSQVNGWPTLVDSTGVGDPIVEDLQRARDTIEGFTFTSRSKQDLMEGLAVAIQSGDIRIPDNEIRRELEVFEYEYNRNSVRYSAPQGLHDDCVCALALAVKHFRQAKHRKPLAMAVIDFDED
jgi:phage FluMu gp28-like protein